MRRQFHAAPLSVFADTRCVASKVETQLERIYAETAKTAKQLGLDEDAQAASDELAAERAKGQAIRRKSTELRHALAAKNLAEAEALSKQIFQQFESDEQTKLASEFSAVQVHIDPEQPQEPKKGVLD